MSKSALERPLLGAPGDGDNTLLDSTAQATVRTGEATAIQLDELGPMVVNSDGTLSRISNWSQLTEAERDRTLRVLSARNRIRLGEQRKLQEQAEVGGRKDEASDQPATAL